MARTYLVALTVLVGAIFLPIMPAYSQTICQPREAAHATLESYNESLLAIGLASSGAIVEIWVSKDSDTWTILAVRPNGEACLVGLGEQWTPLIRGEES